MNNPKVPRHFNGWTAERMNQFMQSPEGVQAFAAGLKTPSVQGRVGLGTASDGVCATLGDEPESSIRKARSLADWMGQESADWNATARAFNEREAEGG